MEMGSVIVENGKKVLAMAEYIEREAVLKEAESRIMWGASAGAVYELIRDAPAADVAPVRHGRWLLEANKDKVNCRWNVTAECSNCCDEKKEIWAGFFPNVPDWLARDTALIDAKSVKLNNYCPNCGAKMDGCDGNNAIT